MAQSQAVSDQSHPEISSSNTNYRDNLIELLHQAETYLQSGDYAATLEVLYLALNLAPIFSTEFKAIRMLIHSLTCPPCLNPSNSNSKDSNREKFVVNLLAILAILVELLKIVLGSLVIAGVLCVLSGIVWVYNAISLRKKEIQGKTAEEITCKDSIEPQTSINF
jgi:hypothetical protein